MERETSKLSVEARKRYEEWAFQRWMVGGRGWIVYSRPAVKMDLYRRIFCSHRPRHQHVAGITYCPWTKAWLFAEWSLDKLDIMTITQWQADWFFGRFIDGEYDWRVVTEKRLRPRILPPLILYCVSAMKETLGIRPWFTWTPWQLFRYIDKRGMAEDFEI